MPGRIRPLLGSGKLDLLNFSEHDDVVDLVDLIHLFDDLVEHLALVRVDVGVDVGWNQVAERTELQGSSDGVCGRQFYGQSSCWSERLTRCLLGNGVQRGARRDRYGDDIVKWQRDVRVLDEVAGQLVCKCRRDGAQLLSCLIVDWVLDSVTAVAARVGALVGVVTGLTSP